MGAAYRASLSGRFRKAMAAQPRELQVRIAAAIRSAKVDPFAGTMSVQGKKFFRRIRVGDHRILFGVDPEQRLLRIGDLKSRGDAYKSEIGDLIKSVERFLAEQRRGVRAKTKGNSGPGPDATN